MAMMSPRDPGYADEKRYNSVSMFYSAMDRTRCVRDDIIPDTIITKTETVLNISITKQKVRYIVILYCIIYINKGS